MSDLNAIMQYLTLGLGTFLGIAGISFIFIRFMAETRGLDWQEEDAAPRHRWGAILLVASAICWAIFIERL
ncbi:hypothetical protein KDL30_03090 [bacterium]|nr:hypothetical protein [bacterium]